MRKKWRRDLGPYKGLHGSASSPIIADGLVVLANDQMDPKRFSFYLPEDTNMDPGKSFFDRAGSTDGQNALENRPEIRTGRLRNAVYSPGG